MSDETRDSSDEETDTDISYASFLDTIKRSMDPNSNTILVVDDERGIRRKVARDVRSFDPEAVVIEAANGKQALEKLAEIRSKFSRDPILIVLDLNMPVMDGWEVIRTLKDEYEANGKSSGIPIVVLSSTSGEKGAFFRKKSVHEGKSGYEPLVSVAKETCADGTHYDASGETGLEAWLKFFVNQG